MEWKRFVWCALLMPECQAFEGSLAWMLYWSNVLFLLDTLKPCYLQTLSIIKASAKSTVLQVALVAGCGSKNKHALPPQATHEPWWRRKHCFVSRPVGEAKTVLPVTMLAKQGRESSCVLDLTHSRRLNNWRVVTITRNVCTWHSNPNFWGEMEWKRFVWCALLMPECQAFEGSLAWMLYWSNVLFLLDTLKLCYLQTLSIIKASAKSTVLQVALVGTLFFWPPTLFFWPPPCFFDPPPCFFDPPPCFFDPPPCLVDPPPCFFSLRFTFLWCFIWGFCRVSCRVWFWYSLGFHLGFYVGFYKEFLIRKSCQGFQTFMWVSLRFL